jgi:hypothetical protein
MAAVVFQETNRNTEYDREAILEMLQACKYLTAKINPTRNGRCPYIAMDTERIAHPVKRVATDPALMFQNAHYQQTRELVEVLNIRKLSLGGGGQELHALRPYLPKQCIDH